MANKPTELSAQQKIERQRAITRQFKIKKLDPYFQGKDGKHDITKIPGFQFGRGTE
jgi:hypothetical protein